MFGSFGWLELLLILIIVLIIFGAGKLPQFGEGLGKAIKGFKKSVHEPEADDLGAPRDLPELPEEENRRRLPGIRGDQVATGTSNEVTPVHEKANQHGKLGVLILATIFMTSGCAGSPEQGRTGKLRYVLIEQKVLPDDLRVNIGDEIRWVNLRPGPVRVTFLGGGLVALTCNRGFTWFGIPQDSATIPPDGYASLCFSSPVTLVYKVTTESRRAEDPASVMATIRVVGPGAQALAREGRS